MEGNWDRAESQNARYGGNKHDRETGSGSATRRGMNDGGERGC